MSLSALAWWRDIASRCGRQAVQLLLPFFALAASGDLTGIQPLGVVDVVGVGVAVVLLKAIAGATVETSASLWVQAAERAASAAAASAAAFLIGDKASLFTLDYRTVGLAVVGSALTAVGMMFTNPPAQVLAGEVLSVVDTPVPEVGRTVLYVVPDSERFALNNGAPVAPAVITRVWNVRTVNLQVHYDGGTVAARTSVTFDDSPAADRGWRWQASVTAG